MRISSGWFTVLAYGRQSAGAFISVCQAVLERDQQLPKLLALILVEPRKKIVFGLTLCPHGANQLLATRGRERHDVAAPIPRVTVARDQARLLERVEHRHEDARVRAHREPQIALREGTLIVQHSEQLELPGREPVGGVDLAHAPHGDVTEQREQQSRAGSALSQQACWLLLGGGWCDHRKHYRHLNDLEAYML